MCLCFWSCLFFFSSRRRHTRSKRDWSSDVCSSDLPGMTGLELQRALADSGATIPVVMISGHADVRIARSEERRVGKECRSRGWSEHSKKKKEGEGLIAGAAGW